MIVSATNFEQKALIGKLRLTSTLSVETGLHIGGSGENLDIGGLDKPVIRDPLTRHPYLPGSSLKGKLRSILERLLKKPINRDGGNIYRYESDDLVDGFTEIKQENSSLLIRYDGASNCQISRVFGSTGVNCWVKADLVEREKLERVSGVEARIIIAASAGENRLGRFERQGEEITEREVREQYIKIKGRNSPARLIVRDCHLSDESVKLLERVDTGLYMTEWKFENGIDRITAAANPRQLERVPAGSKFQFELIYTVEDETQAIEDLQNIAIALALLEDDALGGHGSRGYGKVTFHNFNFSYRSLEQYRRQVTSNSPDESASEPIQSVANTKSFLENFGRFRDQVQQLLLPAKRVDNE